MPPRRASAPANPNPGVGVGPKYAPIVTPASLLKQVTPIFLLLAYYFLPSLPPPPSPPLFETVALPYIPSYPRLFTTKFGFSRYYGASTIYYFTPFSTSWIPISPAFDSGIPYDGSAFTCHASNIAKLDALLFEHTMPAMFPTGGTGVSMFVSVSRWVDVLPQRRSLLDF